MTETTELENPAIQPDVADDIMSQLAEYDNEPVGNDKVSAIPTEPARQSEQDTPAAELTPDNSVSAPEKKERQRDAQGRFIKADGSIDENQQEEVKPEATKEPAKADSNYEKAKKEAVRKERTWQQIEQEKAQVRAQAAHLQQREAQLQQRMQSPNGQGPAQAIGQDATGQPIYSAQTYFEAAKEFANQGDTELAAKAYEAIPIAQRVEVQLRQQQLEQRRNAISLAVMREEPDYANPESPLSKETQAVFRQAEEMAQNTGRQSILAEREDGFAIARDIAKLRLEAGAASGLREENTKLKAELAKYQRLTSVNGSGPTQQGRVQDFDSMTSDQQMAYLERQYNATAA